MNLLVTYDVSTETPQGRRRLRQVAKICKNYGQRVQKSVFECRVDEVLHEKMRRALKEKIKDDEDSVRIYRLPGDRDKLVETMGLGQYVDFEEPLVV